MKSLTKEFIVDFASLLYPRYCFACNEGLAKGEETICSRCMLDLPRTHYHLQHDNALYKRLEGRIPLQFALALFLFRKSGKVQRLLHSLKYHNHPEIGITLGEVYGHELREANYSQKFDIILPVPLHTSRHRKRGYNQSEEFAKGLSQSMNLPTSGEVLERVVKTETQTRKTRLKRWENVSEVFRVKRPDLVSKRRILLVDDVITTGSTIEACANALLNEGCSALSVASIAYAEDGK
jgi:ComF family protein